MPCEIKCDNFAKKKINFLYPIPNEAQKKALSAKLPLNFEFRSARPNLVKVIWSKLSADKASIDVCFEFANYWHVMYGSQNSFSNVTKSKTVNVLIYIDEIGNGLNLDESTCDED